jgi:uncharacterized membrane protein (UPF0127 family)
MENKYIKLRRENGELICDKIRLADDVLGRMQGLMFTKELNNYDGLLLRPGNSIHTFFMLINIDVIFLDKNYKVIKVIYDLKPWRMTRIYFNAFQVLEMKAGTLIKNLEIGESLREYV